TATGSFSSNPFQFTGRENDSTDLHYYRARYYHPGLQRFVVEDPLEFRGGSFNLYAYVHNNAINSKDPLGLYVGAIGVVGSYAIGAGLPGTEASVGGSGFAGWVND